MVFDWLRPIYSSCAPSPDSSFYYSASSEWLRFTPSALTPGSSASGKPLPDYEDILNAESKEPEAIDILDGEKATETIKSEDAAEQSMDTAATIAIQLRPSAGTPFPWEVANQGRSWALIRNCLFSQPGVPGWTDKFLEWLQSSMTKFHWILTCNHVRNDDLLQNMIELLHRKMEMRIV